MNISEALNVEEIINNLSRSEAPMEDFIEAGRAEYDDFESFAWRQGEGYSLPHYPITTDKLEGLSTGLYLFAGESNSGKSAAMINMLYDLATYSENNLYGIYYSLDDSKNHIIPRVISMNTRIPIWAASKPQRLRSRIDNLEPGAFTYQRWLSLREAELNRLKGLADHFRITDSNKIKSAEMLFDHMQKAMIYMRAIDPDRNLIVAIDALNDIRFADKKLKPGTELNAEIARTVKGWTSDLNIPIFGSVHLKKINANRRPILDDLKESGEYVYESSLVWLVHNDVSKNKQNASVFYTEEGRDDKRPVLELDWAKNKVSSYKGRTYYLFSDNISRLTECDTDMSERFDALIYEI